MATEPVSVDARVERLAPGGRLVSRSRLRGGVDSVAERIDIEGSDGTTLSFSVRRSAPDPGDHANVTPEKLAYE